MPDIDPRACLFPALLKHWRGQRGLSQLDLAIAADVSSRHVSFLETGRSTPSPGMILRLAAALDVPLRQVNAMLQAAGHEPAYPEPDAEGALPPEVTHTLQLMKGHHEPFPLVVANRNYDVVDLNAGAAALFGAAIPRLGATADGPLNLFRLTFDPNGAQPVIANFDEIGRALLWRVQREVLAERDGPLRALLDEVLDYSTVAEDWREVDPIVPSSPALVVRLRVEDRELRFFRSWSSAPEKVFDALKHPECRRMPRATRARGKGRGRTPWA